MPIHKVRTLKILEFYTPCPPSLFGYPFDDPFPNKGALADIFLNIYQIISEHFPTITRVMEKLFFAVEFCIRISNRIPCVKVSSN